MMRLFDTARAEVAELQLRDPAKVSMYVCGPTVYGPPHMGHGRFSLVFDVLRRYLEWSGLEVNYVSNITDIDDKIIANAAAEGISVEEFTGYWEKVWYDAMDGLNVKRPTADPHATAYVDEMVAIIADFVARDAAYETSDGVYMDVSTVPDYGLLARQSLDSLQAGARIAVHDEKRSSVDFALWKKTKPGEPAWDSPWGPGRPGWHTECVVMALDLLGPGFDLHGGGQDLAFPHHENERAQSLAWGHQFASHWVHNGFVEVDGEKMSKSLNNYTTLVDFIEKSDQRAYRLLVLRSHYRSPIEVMPETVEDAEAALERLDSFGRRTAELTGEPSSEILDQFRSYMDDDMDTPAVMAMVFETVRAVNSGLDAGEDVTSLVAAIREVTGALGLDLQSGSGEVPADVQAQVAARDDARAAKDWVNSDRLRDELVAAGWIVEDSADGTQVRRA
jgi:cysteinyl-tRNA synthetase